MSPWVGGGSAWSAARRCERWHGILMSYRRRPPDGRGRRGASCSAATREALGLVAAMMLTGFLPAHCLLCAVGCTAGRTVLSLRFQQDVRAGRIACTAGLLGSRRSARGQARDRHHHAAAKRPLRELDVGDQGECGSERSVRPMACTSARTAVQQEHEADEEDAGRTSTSCHPHTEEVDHDPAAEWITVSPPPKSCGSCTFSTTTSSRTGSSRG